MMNDLKFDDSIIELIRTKLEELDDIELSDFNQYQLVELWINRTLTERIHFVKK
jgi:hypothetical protein